MQYTEQVNLALKYAKQTAKQCGQSYIGSEHLLMGLLREESGMASAILKECKVDAEKLYGLIQELIVPEGMLADKASTGYSLRAQEILEQGEEEAEFFRSGEDGNRAPSSGNSEGCRLRCHTSASYDGSSGAEGIYGSSGVPGTGREPL